MLNVDRATNLIGAVPLVLVLAQYFFKIELPQDVQSAIVGLVIAGVSFCVGKPLFPKFK